MLKISKRMIRVVALIMFFGGIMANAEDGNRKAAITGNYIKAILIAYADFIKIADMSEEEKDLKHYDIECSDDNNDYIVEFVPKLLTEDDAKKLNRMVFGRNTKYWIDKKTHKINKRVFYKA